MHAPSVKLKMSTGISLPLGSSALPMLKAHTAAEVRAPSQLDVQSPAPQTLRLIQGKEVDSQIRATLIMMLFSARCMPGQMRRPKPNAE